MSKWIDVNERKPKMHREQCIIRGEVSDEYDVSDEVLAYTTYGRIIVARCKPKDKEKKEFWWTDSGGTDYTVTHWMPLPKPPKEV